jgi:hypothetical protein
MEFEEIFISKKMMQGSKSEDDPQSKGGAEINRN